MGVDCSARDARGKVDGQAGGVVTPGFPLEGKGHTVASRL